jgi:hypothetical protein
MSRSWPRALAALAIALCSLVAAAPSLARGSAPPSPGRSVVLAFMQTAHPEQQLASIPGLSLGIMSASQGTYSRAQLLLDITQGSRVATSAYAQPLAPRLEVQPAESEGIVLGWTAARKRAEAAPQTLRPGLLASVAGGAGYAGVSGEDNLDAIAAAGHYGAIAAYSLGSAATLPARASALLAGRRLVVCDLPAGAAGAAALRSLLATRAGGELVVVVQRLGGRPPHGQLLWTAAAGLPGHARGELTSATTAQRGLLASIDVAPTIITHLGAAVPPQMRGAPLRGERPLDAAGLRSLAARLQVVGPRRLKALAFLLCGWALLLLACAAGPRAWAVSWAMRAGALGVLWAPAVTLVTAALAPGAAVEYAIIALGCLALGAITDRLLPWPRAPLAPGLVTITALVADALAGSQLLMRSLLGPDPVLGARFHGFGNELKSALAVLVLASTAAALSPGAGVSRDRRAAAAIFAGTGALLALIEGWTRIGAAVGGVILVCAGAAVASIMLLPGGVTRRRALIVLVSPVAGLILLAVLDLAAAHGTGHYTGSILHAHSAGDIRDVLVRRYSAAWHELRNHAMPAATALALALAALAIRKRRALLIGVRGERLWLAALSGGLAAGVVGALVEDSGPVLLVVAVFALGCLVCYLRAPPPLPAAPPRSRPAASLRAAG